MDCPFCEGDDVRERIIVENEFAYALPTNIPIVPGHVLIVPKRHLALVEEATDQERAAIESLRIALKAALLKAVDAAGFNYAWNEGAVAGQSIPHLHLHVVPRKEGDAGVHGYEPRIFLYRPGSRSKSPTEELKAVAALIRSAL